MTASGEQARARIIAGAMGDAPESASRPPTIPSRSCISGWCGYDSVLARHKDTRPPKPQADVSHACDYTTLALALALDLAFALALALPLPLPLPSPLPRESRPET